MERNLIRRVETCFPIIEKSLLRRVEKEGLEIYLQDNCQAWTLNNDGSYSKVSPGEGEERISAQEYLMDKLGK